MPIEAKELWATHRKTAKAVFNYPPPEYNDTTPGAKNFYEEWAKILNEDFEIRKK